MSTHAASVRFILITLVIDALGFGLVVPIVPSLVLKLSGLGVSGASEWVGLLLASFALMQFVCAPVLGGLSDRFGRRPVLLLSLAGMGANYLMLAWAPSLAWLFLGRLIAGATAANASTATAYIADVTPPKQRAGQFGLVGAMFGVGFVVGPALGGVLGAYGLRVPFFVAAGLSACNVLYGLLVLPESLPPERRRPIDWRRANPLGSLRLVMASRNLGRLAIAWGCIWFALGALQSTFVLANQARFGWDTRHNGLALALAGLGSAVVQGLLVRRIVPALGERRAAMIGGVLAACAYLCMGLAPFGWVVLLGIVLHVGRGDHQSGGARHGLGRRRGGPAGGDAGGAFVGAGADRDRVAAGRQLGVFDVHRAGRAGSAAGGAVRGFGAGVRAGDLGGVRRPAGARHWSAPTPRLQWPRRPRQEDIDEDSRPETAGSGA